MPIGGIIPARAGFTKSSGGNRSPYPDHPRSRGVYVAHHLHNAVVWGSSPLARGLQNLPAGIEVRTRIIPARAGFTLRIICIMRSFGDHPRSRGVYSRHPHSPPKRAGSSPLARGLREDNKFFTVQWGIIPARAGFTYVIKKTHRSSQDHTRSRGVYPSSLCSLTVRPGSSPLARGLQKFIVQDDGKERIIPARAGFTAKPMPHSSTRPDHPRSRGVYAGLVCPVPHRSRIIPARAGFTPYTTRA